jgi:hypothetical protein
MHDMNRPVEAEDWIARQPRALRVAGAARAEKLIRRVTLREVRGDKRTPGRS